MEPLHPDSGILEPLDTDELIERRIGALVGRALSRQLWLLFLDDDHVQLPLVMPISDVPILPQHTDLPHWSELLRGTTEAVNARSVVVVLERYGGERLTVADRAWARLSRDGCDDAHVGLRAVLLSHRRGVRLVTPDEYA